MQKLDKQSDLIEKLRLPYTHFTSQFELNELLIKNYEGDIKLTPRRQMILELMPSIQDNLYSIGQLTMNSPMQAGIIAATIYEQVQYAIHFYFHEEALNNYLTNGHKNFKKEIRDFLEIKQIDKITQDNLNKIGAARSGENLYSVYRMLCRFKHPHPKFLRLLLNKETKELISPSSIKNDERTLSISYYILYNSACLSSMLSLLILEDLKEMGKDIISLVEKYNKTVTLSTALLTKYG